MATTRTKQHQGQQILVYNAGLQPYGAHSKLEEVVNHIRLMEAQAPDVFVIHDALNNTALIDNSKRRTTFYLAETEFRGRYAQSKPDEVEFVGFLDKQLTPEEKKLHHFDVYKACVDEAVKTSKELYADVARQIRRLPKKTQAVIVPGQHDVCTMVYDKLDDDGNTLANLVLHREVKDIKGLKLAGIGAVGNSDITVPHDMTPYADRDMREEIKFLDAATAADILFVSNGINQYYDDSIKENAAQPTDRFAHQLNAFFLNEWLLACGNAKKAKLVVTQLVTTGKPAGKRAAVWGNPLEYSPLVLNAGQVRTEDDSKDLGHEPYLISYNGHGAEHIWYFSIDNKTIGVRNQKKHTVFALPALYERGSTDPGKSPTRPGTRIVLPVMPGVSALTGEAPVIQGMPIPIPESAKPVKKTTVKAPVVPPARAAEAPKEKYVKPPMPKVTLPRKPSKLELSVVDAWQQYADRIELMGEQRRDTMHEILQSIISRDERYTHTERIYNLVGTVMYGSADLTGNAVKPASALMDAYAQRLGKTAFAKNNKKEYAILTLLANNLNGVLPLLQYVNGQIKDMNDLHRDELVAKDERISSLETELGDVFANYSKAIRLSRKAEKLFESEPEQARELYKKAYEIAPFRETKKSIAENIAGIFYNTARDGSNKAYDEALRWYKKSWRTDETKAYIADCKDQLGIQPAAQPKTDVMPAVKFEQQPI